MATSRKPQTTEETSTEVEVVDSRDFTSEFVRQATSGELTLDDLAGLLGHKVQDVGEALGILGVEKDKASFVATDMVVLGFAFLPGDYGPDSEYAAITVAPVHDGRGIGKPVILTDGSSGLYRQLRQFQDERVSKGAKPAFRCPNGLNASQYRYCGECEQAVDDDHENHGKPVIPAVTYYFAG